MKLYLRHVHIYVQQLWEGARRIWYMRRFFNNTGTEIFYDLHRVHYTRLFISTCRLQNNIKMKNSLVTLYITNEFCFHPFADKVPVALAVRKFYYTVLPHSPPKPSYWYSPRLFLAPNSTPKRLDAISQVPKRKKSRFCRAQPSPTCPRNRFAHIKSIAYRAVQIIGP
jgi:hypothetical protein